MVFLALYQQRDFYRERPLGVLFNVFGNYAARLYTQIALKTSYAGHLCSCCDCKAVYLKTLPYHQILYAVASMDTSMQPSMLNSMMYVHQNALMEGEESVWESESWQAHIQPTPIFISVNLAPSMRHHRKTPFKFECLEDSSL